MTPALLSVEEEAVACRAAFAGYGIGDWALHIHHDRLVETLTEPPAARIDYILAQKPERERPLRLRLFRPVKATAERRKAYAEWRKADAALRKADAGWGKTDAEWRKVYAELQKATAKWWKADAEWREATTKWHRAACRDCPWDGATIFSAGLPAESAP